MDFKVNTNAPSSFCPFPQILLKYTTNASYIFFNYRNYLLPDIKTSLSYFCRIKKVFILTDGTKRETNGINFTKTRIFTEILNSS